MDRFNVIFTKVFSCSKKAIIYCQNLSRLCGFSVRIRTSKTTSIYIVCSREGLPEPQREQSKKRSRLSDRCNCEWKIVLYRRSPNQWEFRSGKSSEHNHVIYSSEEAFDVEADFMKGSTLPSCPTNNFKSSGPSSPPLPLPPLKSLDLPFLGSQSSELKEGTTNRVNISPDSSDSDSNSSPLRVRELIHSLPLTRALPKIMKSYNSPHVPGEPITTRTHLSFLLN